MTDMDMEKLKINSKKFYEGYNRGAAKIKPSATPALPSSKRSALRHQIIAKICEDCETWEPLSDVQKSAIAGTVMGIFSVVDIFGEVAAVEKWKQNNEDVDASRPPES